MATATLRNWNPDGRAIDAPPAYFLQRLQDFDAMLVLMPSREQPEAFVLGRRKQFGPGLTEKGLAGIYAKADTRMAILNGTAPVCMVYKPVSGNWNPDTLLVKLAARDIWAHGGADKVADTLEAQEDAEKKALQKSIRDDLYNRSGDAWRSYQARTGQANHLFHERFPTTGNPPHGAGVPVLNSDSSSTAGLGKLRTRKAPAKRKRNATIGRRGHR